MTKRKKYRITIVFLGVASSALLMLDRTSLGAFLFGIAMGLIWTLGNEPLAEEHHD